MGSAQRLLRVSLLNTVPASYGPILRLQELLWEQRRQGLIEDTLLLLQRTPLWLQHSSVYTIGKRGSEADFLADQQQLQAAGAEVYVAPRGGETTWHGPGQLVAYPILSLRELAIGARAYVEGLEDAMVATAARYGVAARGRVPGKTGVWAGDRKLGAVGVRISHGVTSHGTALNVCPNLAAYRHIIPCGTPDKQTTSLERELGRPVGLEEAAHHFLSAFLRQFGHAPVTWTDDVLGLCRQLGVDVAGGRSGAAETRRAADTGGSTGSAAHGAAAAGAT